MSGWNAKVQPSGKTVPSKPSNYAQVLADWAGSWRTPQLPGLVEVTFSRRMTRSLGRVHPATGVICLSARLQAAPRDLLLEVLCHEAAHVAAYQIHGPQAKPRGPEWRDLVRRAGYQPTTKLAHPALQPPRLGSSSNPAASSPRLGVRHRYRCPVCDHDYFVPRKSSSLFCNLCQSSENLEPLQYQPLSRIA